MNPSAGANIPMRDATRSVASSPTSARRFGDKGKTRLENKQTAKNGRRDQDHGRFEYDTGEPETGTLREELEENQRRAFEGADLFLFHIDHQPPEANAVDEG